MRAALLLLAATLASAGTAGAGERCAPALSIRDARAGGELARVPLDAEAPRFATAYRHSVTGATVTDEYRIRDSRIVLVRETFAGAGYGLAHGPNGAAERLDLQPDGRAALTLERPIDRLVVRVGAAAENRITEPQLLDLTRWGDGPRELAVHECPNTGTQTP